MTLHFFQDNFDWTRIQGTTPSWDTGPGYDHTYNDTFGHFAYIETSYPRIPDDKAILTSPWIKTENPATGLYFVYNFILLLFKLMFLEFLVNLLVKRSPYSW